MLKSDLDKALSVLECEVVDAGMSVQRLEERVRRGALCKSWPIHNRGRALMPHTS